MELTDKVTGYFSGKTGANPNATVADLIDVVRYGPGAGVLTEHSTGLHWIDGKEIFRRVVIFDTFVSGLSTAPFNMAAIGVDTVIRLTTSLTGAANSKVFSDGQLLINDALNEIRLNHGAFVLLNGHAIVEYTKT